MAYTMTADISRMIVAGQKEIFMKNFEAFPREYPDFTTEKTSTKKTETYDSMGNLQAAQVKQEGDAIVYNSLGQAYQTSITNETIANGFEHTFESAKYDLYGVINSIKAKELSRTMAEFEENRVIREWDNAFATNLSDGYPLCTNTRPCVNATGVYNDTLATTSSLSVPENHKTMIKMFASFKNHAGGNMKMFPTDGLSHSQNMLDIEEIYQSTNKASEISNTKNTLPKITWHYSTYLSSKTAWFMWAKAFEHVLLQWFMRTEFGEDTDKKSTLNVYLNAVAIYNSGTMNNIGIVGNSGV